MQTHSKTPLRTGANTCPQLIAEKILVIINTSNQSNIITQHIGLYDVLRLSPNADGALRPLKETAARN